MILMYLGKKVIVKNYESIKKPLKSREANPFKLGVKGLLYERFSNFLRDVCAC